MVKNVFLADDSGGSPMDDSQRSPKQTNNETNEDSAAGSNQNAESDEKNAMIDALPVFFPAISGCRSVAEFDCMNRIEEGTYGVVYRAKDKRTDEIVALKRLKMEKEREGFPITSLREINTLLKAQHPNIVTVRVISTFFRTCAAALVCSARPFLWSCSCTPNVECVCTVFSIADDCCTSI